MPNTKVIKLPVENKGITVNSIWKTINAIAETGSTFTIKQLSESSKEVSKSTDYLSRMLSYLKFLNVIEETRGKETEQKFTLA